MTGEITKGSLENCVEEDRENSSSEEESAEATRNLREYEKWQLSREKVGDELVNGVLMEGGCDVTNVEAMKETGKDIYNIYTITHRGSSIIGKSLLKSLFIFPSHLRNELSYEEHPNTPRSKEDIKANISAVTTVLYSSGLFIFGATSCISFVIGEFNELPWHSFLSSAYFPVVLATNALSGVYEIFRHKKNNLVEEKKKSLETLSLE